MLSSLNLKEAFYLGIGTTFKLLIDVIFLIDDASDALMKEANKHKISFLKKNGFKPGEIFIVAEDFTPKYIYENAENAKYPVHQNFKKGQAIILLAVSSKSVTGWTSHFDMHILADGNKYIVATTFPGFIKIFKKMLPKEFLAIEKFSF